jgi:response regulator RpfG family c-di-GMP phosphodiesterase
MSTILENHSDVDDARCTVLCVDDERNILSSLKRLFRKSPFDVIMILPSNEGHPVKRVTFATEVDHDKTINREKAGKETAHAGI